MKARLVLKALTAAVLLASCAATPRGQDALRVRPLEEVQHSYDRAQAHYELGRYYHGQRRYAQAIDAYRRALAIEPGKRDAEIAIGVAYAERGDLARAREQLERAVALHPQSADARNNLGFALHLAGDYPAAVSAYKQALRLDGRHAKARENLLRAMSAMGAGERIARSEPAAVPAAASATAAQARPAWVQVAPYIFELRAGDAAHTGPDRTRRDAGDAEDASPSAAPGRALEIANGNGVRGMARTVARYLSERGLGEPRLTNQRPFRVRATRIEYRAGSAMEAAELARLLPARVPHVMSSTLRADVRVRVVLGQDIGDQIAYFQTAPATRLARMPFATTGR